VVRDQALRLLRAGKEGVSEWNKRHESGVEMRDPGLRVWYAPENVQGGKKHHEQTDEAIWLYDELIGNAKHDAW